MFQVKRFSTARLCATRCSRLFARRPAQVIATAALLGLLTGCQNIAGNTSAAQLRIITASPDAPGLDIYAGTGALAYNLGFGTITSYVPINAGTYVINADTAGTTQVLTTTKATLADSSEYTDLIGNSAANLQQTILKDQSQAAPSGQIALRFVDQVTTLGALDIYMVPAGQKLVNVVRRGDQHLLRGQYRLSQHTDRLVLDHYGSHRHGAHQYHNSHLLGTARELRRRLSHNLRHDQPAIDHHAGSAGHHCSGLYPACRLSTQQPSRKSKRVAGNIRRPFGPIYFRFLSNFLVPVVLRLVWSLCRYAQVVRLLLRERRQLHADLL